MPLQSWQSSLNFGNPWSSTSGPVVGTLTTTSIITPGFGNTPSLPDFQIPANYWYPGKQMRLTLAGQQTTASSAATIQLQFMIGATEAAPPSGGAAALNSGTINTIVSQTNAMWRAEAILRCRSYASATTANVMSLGRIEWYNPTISTTANYVLPWAQNGVTAPADVAVTLASAFVFATVTYSNTGTNNIQVHHYLLEDVT